MKIDLLTAWRDYLTRYSRESGAWLALHRVQHSMPAGDRDKLTQNAAALSLPDGEASLFRAVFMFVSTGAEDWLERPVLRSSSAPGSSARTAF